MPGIVTIQSVFCAKEVKLPVRITLEEFPIDFQGDIHFNLLIWNVSFRKVFFATINRIVPCQSI